HSSRPQRNQRNRADSNERLKQERRRQAFPEHRPLERQHVRVQRTDRERFVACKPVAAEDGVGHRRELRRIEQQRLTQLRMLQQREMMKDANEYGNTDWYPEPPQGWERPCATFCALRRGD